MESCASLALAASFSASGVCVYSTYSTPPASASVSSRAAICVRLPFLGRSYDTTGENASNTETCGGTGRGVRGAPCVGYGTEWGMKVVPYVAGGRHTSSAAQSARSAQPRPRLVLYLPSYTAFQCCRQLSLPGARGFALGKLALALLWALP